MPFQHLLTDTVYIAEPTGVSDFGDQTYGPTVSISCALETGFNKILDSSGDETLSARSFATGTELSLRVKVWFNLADVGDDSLSQSPISITSAPSRIRSARLYEVFF